MIQQTGILQSISGNALKFLVVVTNRKCPVSLKATPEAITKAVGMIGEYTRFTVVKAEIIDIILEEDARSQDKTKAKRKPAPKASKLDECEKAECPNGGLRCYKDNGRTEYCLSCLCLRCTHAKCPIAVEGNP